MRLLLLVMVSAWLVAVDGFAGLLRNALCDRALHAGQMIMGFPAEPAQSRTLLLTRITVRFCFSNGHLCGLTAFKTWRACDR